MTPEQFSLLREILLTVPRLDQNEQSAYLDRICAGDEELRREAESLLASGGDIPEILNTGGMKEFARSALAEQDLGRETPIPESIGPYRVEGVLGSGGMGVVYRAQQDEPIKRQVAIKLMHSRVRKEATARFLAERQALAMMDHPNIAKVLDAGSTENDQPYLVMEIVDGQPIDEYCDQQGLSVRQRVALAIDACHGVHHAHQKGIIHRDLKPANLLVTATERGPGLKIIDFGIARTLAESGPDQTLLTQEGQILGTPEYMSPEQANGDVAQIDVRTDIYSLGVIMYQLLSGGFPYDVRGISLLKRAKVISTAPVKPLRTSDTKNIDPDLDTIIMKALSKNPNDRYASAAGLGGDLNRFMNGQPIIARPPSTTYMMRKLIGRNRVWFVSAVIIFIMLVGFGIGMTILADGQRQALVEAEMERRKASRINTFLQDMLASANPENEGKDVTVVEVVHSAARRVEFDLADEPVILAAVRTTLANTFSSLGEYETSVEQYNKAISDLHNLPEIPAGELVENHEQLARTLAMQGDYELSREHLGHALKLVEQQGEEDTDLARYLGHAAMVEMEAGKHALAESLAIKSLELHEKAGTLRSLDGSTALHAYAWSQMILWNWVKAEEAYEELISLRGEILGKTHPEYYDAKNDLAMVLEQTTKWRQALEIKREIRDVYLDIYGKNHPLTAVALNNLAATRMMSSIDLDEASSDMKQAIAIWEETLGRDHPYLITGHNNVGFIYHQQLDYKKAETEYRVALAVAEAAGNHSAMEYPFVHLASCLVHQGSSIEAEEFLLTAGEIIRFTKFRETIRGMALFDQLRVSQADSALRVTLLGLEKASWMGIVRPICANTVGRILGGVGAEADSLLAKSKPYLLNGAKADGGDWLAWRLYSIEKTIPMYEGLGEFEEANEYRRAADRIRRRAAGEVDLANIPEVGSLD